MKNYRKRWPHHTELNKSAFNRQIRVNDANIAPLWVGVAHIAPFTFNLRIYHAFDDFVGCFHPVRCSRFCSKIPLDGIPFHPYYTIHDLIGIGVFLLIFSAIIFFAPEMGGFFLEYNNFIPADPLQTPAHIAPVWYFTPYYSMLRAVTDPMVNVFAVVVALAAVLAVLKGGLSSTWKVAVLVGAAVVIAALKIFDAKFWGVVVMGVAVLVLFPLPWLDRSPVKSMRYKGPIFKFAVFVFVICFFVLGYLGVLPVSPGRTLVSQICSVLYFAFFLLMPWYSKIDKCKAEPERVNFK